MNIPRTRWRSLCASTLMFVLLSALPNAHAHLMPTQRGTLNVVDDGAFMALSLPVSAFNGVDENGDGDGEWSMIEFNSHRLDISKIVAGGVTLSD